MQRKPGSVLQPTTCGWLGKNHVPKDAGWPNQFPCFPFTRWIYGGLLLHGNICSGVFGLTLNILHDAAFPILSFYFGTGFLKLLKLTYRSVMAITPMERFALIQGQTSSFGNSVGFFFLG